MNRKTFVISIVFLFHAFPSFADTDITISTGSSSVQNSTCGTTTERTDSQSFEHMTACFLAGLPLPVHSPWDACAATDAWRRYASSMKEKWARFFATRGKKIDTWRRAELKGTPRTATIFYPFSGPDFLYLHILFPEGSRYVLVGLEPVGSIPSPREITPQNIESCLTHIEKTLEDILLISFFKTNDMSKELSSGCLTGTLPILMIFLAQTSHQIDSVHFFDLADNGTVLSRPSPCDCASGKRRCRGVEISFSSPSGETKTLVYLSANLSDFGLLHCQGCKYYYEALQPPLITFIKSASYLLHKNYFSHIRDLILDKSFWVLQDDSGIPYRYFDSRRWDTKLYGTYEGPIALFKNHLQKDLAAAYRIGAVPLPFRFGYTARSNLLKAVKKADANAE